MNSVFRKLALVCVLFLPLGCGGSTSEIGSSETTPEMTQEQKSEKQKGKQEKYKAMMKENEKKSQ